MFSRDEDAGPGWPDALTGAPQFRLWLGARRLSPFLKAVEELFRNVISQMTEDVFQKYPLAICLGSF